MTGHGGRNSAVRVTWLDERVTWLDERRQAQHPPPPYPNGIDVESDSAAEACTQVFPYPAIGCAPRRRHLGLAKKAASEPV